MKLNTKKNVYIPVHKYQGAYENLSKPEKLLGNYQNLWERYFIRNVRL